MLVDAELVGNVKALLEDFIDELASTTKNNNQLKENALNLERAARLLREEVMKLPPQGRVVGFKATGTLMSRALFGRAVKNYMEKRRGGRRV